jgi:hypothetical protein
VGRHVAFSQQRTRGKLDVQLFDDGNYPLYSVGRYHGSRHAWPDGRRHEITSRPQSAASGGANEYLAKILCRGTIPFSEENLVLLALKRDSSLGTASCRQTDHFLAGYKTLNLLCIL